MTKKSSGTKTLMLTNCPDHANADQADFDGDGIGDACDPDIDNDGTDDEFECSPYDDTDATLFADDGDCDGIPNDADCLVHEGTARRPQFWPTMPTVMG